MAVIDKTPSHSELAILSNLPLAIATGRVEGVSHINKFGENPDVAANTTEDIWDGGGDYSFPTTADITHISQATDQVGTDGGATIEVQGLDTDWNLTVQTVDLDGTDTTTQVALTTPLRRVFRLKVMENIVLADDVTVEDTTGLIDYATIQAGNNQTLMAIYTVPANKTAYLSHYYASNTLSLNKEPKGTTIRLWVADRANSYEFQLKHSLGIQLGGANIEHFFAVPMKITEKSDIKITGLSYDQPGQISAGFDLIIVDN